MCSLILLLTTISFIQFYFIISPIFKALSESSVGTLDVRVRLCGGQQPFRVSSYKDLECTVLYVLCFY